MPDYFAQVKNEDVARLMQSAYAEMMGGNAEGGKSLLTDAVELGKKNNVGLKSCEIMAMVYTDIVLGLEDKMRSLLGFLSGTTKHLPDKENLEKYPEIAKISELIGTYLLAFYEMCGNSIRCGDSDE